MNTITGIRELDVYLVLFFDQNTIYNYNLLSKETNQIAADHELFKTLKEYQKTKYPYENILSWAIRNDRPYILDWFTNLVHKFENISAIINMAIIYDSTKILDWFYQRNMFDYVLISLIIAVQNGCTKTIDWFYNHQLEERYLDKLLVEQQEELINFVENHVSLLKILKWYHGKNYSLDFDFCKKINIIQEGSIELIGWLLEKKLIDRSIFADEQYYYVFNTENLSVEKQIATLTLLKDLDFHFENTIGSLVDGPIEILVWFRENIYHIELVDIFRSAAETGNYSVMKWTGIDKNHPDFKLLDGEDITEYAIKHCHTDMIEWCFENIIFSRKNLDNLFKKFGSLAGLSVEKIIQFEKYFEKYDYPLVTIYPNLAKNAFVNGNLPVLEYLIPKLQPEQTVCIDIHGVGFRISNGNILILKWVEKYLSKNDNSSQVTYIEGKCDLTNNIDDAASHGYLETIKWAKHFLSHKFGYKKAIDYAAQKLNFDMLNWFNKLFGAADFKYTSNAIVDSIENGGLRIFKWFESSGHPLKYSNYAIDVSIRHGRIEILQWLKENGYPMTFTCSSIFLACTSIIKSYPLRDISFAGSLQWLQDNGVIKILDREMVNDLLVFKIELAQPFAKSNRLNVRYENVGLVATSNKYIRVTTDSITDPTTNEMGIVKSELQDETTTIKIEFSYKEIYDISYVGSDIECEHYDVYYSLCWFENQYKLLDY